MLMEPPIQWRLEHFDTIQVFLSMVFLDNCTLVYTSDTLSNDVSALYAAALIPGSRPVNGFHQASFKLSQKLFLEC